MFELIFPVIVLLIMAIVILAIGAVAKKSEERANEQLIRAKGTVIDYKRGKNRNGQWVKPILRYRETIHTVDRVSPVRYPYKADPFRWGPGSNPIMLLVIDGETVECPAKCHSNCRQSDYPIGTVFNLLYRKKTLSVLGDFYDIRVDEDGLRPIPMMKAAGIISQAVALVLFLVSVVIAVILWS